jgi:long-subunit acyl-CoA synthetase (AMP-forming)
MHLAAQTKRPNADSWRLGLWSLNRPEWQIVSLAASAYSLVFVSLYETLGPNVVEYCINHAEVNVRCFVCSQANPNTSSRLYSPLLPTSRSYWPCLKNVLL